MLLGADNHQPEALLLCIQHHCKTRSLFQYQDMSWLGGLSGLASINIPVSTVSNTLSYHFYSIHCRSPRYYLRSFGSTDTPIPSLQYLWTVLASIDGPGSDQTKPPRVLHPPNSIQTTSPIALRATATLLGFPL